MVRRNHRGYGSYRGIAWAGREVFIQGVDRENLPVYPDLLVLFDGCLEVGDTVIHVVPKVGEALARHCAEDLANGRQPLVLTLDDGVTIFRTMLGYAGLAERVEVMDALDFLATGMLTLANFRAEQCQSMGERLFYLCGIPRQA